MNWQWLFSGALANEDYQVATREGAKRLLEDEQTYMDSYSTLARAEVFEGLRQQVEGEQAGGEGTSCSNAGHQFFRFCGSRQYGSVVEDHQMADEPQAVRCHPVAAAVPTH